MTTEPRQLEPGQLCRRCDPGQLGFETTEALEDLPGVLAQPRAMAALAFSVGMKHPGYHLFALGREGIGKRFAIQSFLNRHAKSRPTPSDWCYVYNFEKPDRPSVLRLPPGLGSTLKSDMEELVEDLKSSLNAALNSEEYQTRRALIDKEFNDIPQSALDKIRERAEKQGFTLLRTPGGLMFAPVEDGDVMPKEVFDKLPDEDKKRLGEQTAELEREVKEIVERVPDLDRERRARIRELNREVTSTAVTRLVNHLRQTYSEVKNVLSYLDGVEKDVMANARELIEPEPPSPLAMLGGPVAQQLSGKRETMRYQVNVLVDHSDSKGAPVHTEDHPSHQNLLGRVEHVSHLGTLTTDFRLIRPGALHRANGGYLLLDARKLLTQPLAWEGLKRALRCREVRIESLGEAMSLVSTISLDPEPIPLDIKIVLYGEPRIYYLLSELDPEFSELFKVAADFANDMDRTDANEHKLARLIATMARQHELHPVDSQAVARIVDESSRRIGDAQKLSIHSAELVDLLCEADYFARNSEADTIRACDVREAIEAREFRADRARERIQESISRDLALIDTSGEKVGQINGLSVLQLGEFRFGRPSRITARVRLGKGNVIDIEREVELGGPLHSKGVLILSGFLGERYARERPLALTASLVFEQSYFGVEGDSASAAELAALVSAIAGVPIRQDVAITGSINQLGQIQPIGGVNEKVEGFFDVCKKRGLTGSQGVIIPQSNTQHLMLRADVIAAAAENQFHIWPVSTIDEAVSILTGLAPGARDEDGIYPEGSVNRLVDDRLGEFADRLAEIGKRES